MRYLGAIEAGGTKFVCGIGTPEGQIVDKTSFPTTTPEETLGNVFEYFADKPLDALGIGSFGPIDVNPESPTYGYITNTPKPHWSYYNLVGKLREVFDVPIGFDTDVNAAALGEARWGAAREISECLYITIGTGIGAGLVRNGSIVNGVTHPEMGHILVRKHPNDSFSGTCPFHGDCLEGLASGPSIEQRWGKNGKELPFDHPAWELEAEYLAQAIMNYILILMPQKILLGGGVSKQTQLFPLIRQRLRKLLNGYVTIPQLQEHWDTYITPPGLGDNAGLTGAVALAFNALQTGK